MEKDKLQTFEFIIILELFSEIVTIKNNHKRIARENFYIKSLDPTYHESPNAGSNLAYKQMETHFSKVTSSGEQYFNPEKKQLFCQLFYISLMAPFIKNLPVVGARYIMSNVALR